MLRLLGLVVIAGALAAVEDGVWVEVNYFDRADEEGRYVFALVERADLERLRRNDGAGGFLRLERVCYYDYDDDDEPVGLVRYADWKDNGVLLIRAARIGTIVELNGEPGRLLEEHRRETGADEKPAGSTPDVPRL